MLVNKNINSLTNIDMSKNSGECQPKNSVKELITHLWHSLYTFSEDSKGRPYKAKSIPCVKLKRLSTKEIKDATTPFRLSGNTVACRLMSDDECPDLEMLWNKNNDLKKPIKIVKEENVDAEVLRKISNIKEGCSNMAILENLNEPEKPMAASEDPEEKKSQVGKLIKEYTNKWTESDWNEKKSMKTVKCDSPSMSKSTVKPYFKAKPSPFACLKGSSNSKLKDKTSDNTGECKRKQSYDNLQLKKRLKIEKLFKEKKELIQNRSAQKQSSIASRSLVSIPSDVLDEYIIPKPTDKSNSTMDIVSEIPVELPSAKSAPVTTQLETIATPIATSVNDKEEVQLFVPPAIDLPMDTSSSQTYTERDLVRLANESAGLFSNMDLNDLAVGASQTVNVMVLANKSSQTAPISRCVISTQTSLASPVNKMTSTQISLKKTKTRASQTSAAVFTGENFDRNFFDVVAKEKGNPLSDLPESENPLNNPFHTMKVVKYLNEMSKEYRANIERERDDIISRVKTLYDDKLSSIIEEINKQDLLFNKILDHASKVVDPKDVSADPLSQEIRMVLNQYRKGTDVECDDKVDNSDGETVILEQLLSLVSSISSNPNSPDSQGSTITESPCQEFPPSPMPPSTSGEDSRNSPVYSPADSLISQDVLGDVDSSSSAAESLPRGENKAKISFNTMQCKSATTGVKNKPYTKSPNRKRIGIIAEASVSNFGKTSNAKKSIIKAKVTVPPREVDLIKTAQSNNAVTISYVSDKKTILDSTDVVQKPVNTFNVHGKKQPVKSFHIIHRPNESTSVKNVPHNVGTGEKSTVLNKGVPCSKYSVPFNWKMGQSRASDVNPPSSSEIEDPFSKTGFPRRIMPQFVTTPSVARSTVTKVVTTPSGTRNMPIIAAALNGAGSMPQIVTSVDSPRCMPQRPTIGSGSVRQISRMVTRPGAVRNMPILSNNAPNIRPCTNKNMSQQDRPAPQLVNYAPRSSQPARVTVLKQQGIATRRPYVPANIQGASSIVSNQQQIYFSHPSLVPNSMSQVVSAQYPTVQNNQLCLDSRQTQVMVPTYVQQLSNPRSYTPQAAQVTYSQQFSAVQPTQEVISVQGNNLQKTSRNILNPIPPINQANSSDSSHNWIIKSVVGGVSENEFQEPSGDEKESAVLPSYNDSVHHLQTVNTQLTTPTYGTLSSVVSFTDQTMEGQSQDPVASSSNRRVSDEEMSDLILNSRTGDLVNCEDVSPITCFLCGMDAQFTCCGPFKYCSDDCKEQDSERHKLECQAEK